LGFQGAGLNFPGLANFARLNFFKPSEQRRESEPKMKWKQSAKTAPAGGVAGWLLGRLRASSRPQPKLELLERIALAPRQSLALVAAEGRRFLVATSPEGAPAFYALDEGPRPAAVNGINRQRGPVRAAVRVSW
jgi:hypothetical protein